MERMLASSSNDKTLRLWNVRSGQPISNAPDVHTSSISLLDANTVAFESDELTLPFAHEPWLAALPFHFDREGFLRYASARLLRMPVFLSGVIDVHQSSIVIGGYSGAVTILRWPVPLSHVGRVGRLNINCESFSC